MSRDKIRKKQHRDLLDQAVEVHRRGNLAEAAELYRRMLAADPLQADAWNLLGLTAYQEKRYAYAEPCFREAIALLPKVAYYHGNLALALQAMERLEEAEASYQQGLQLEPGNVEILNNLGTLLEQRGRLEEAEQAYRQALARNARHPDSLYNLGHVRFQLGNLAAAQQAYELALTEAPSDPKIHWNLSLALLMAGQLKRGFAEYEYRWQGSIDSVGTRCLDGPQWRGQRSSQTRVVIYREQGLGDTLQFARYIPAVAARVGRVIFICDRQLERLMRFSLGHVAEVRPESQPLSRAEYDLQSPLCSLPLALSEGEQVPLFPETPYLMIPPGAREAWKQRLASLSGLKVGIVWAGHKGNRNDKRRSIPLAQWAPILSLTGVSFVSLQKEVAPEAEPLLLRYRIADWMGLVEDFADTAALVANLDLVIGVDTSVIHLAGALGKPAWMLNRSESEWRWQRSREDSPWYTTLRLFNQESPDNWEPTLKRLAEALASLAGSRLSA